MKNIERMDSREKSRRKKEDTLRSRIVYTGGELYKIYGYETTWFSKEIKSGYVVYGGPANKLVDRDKYKNVDMLLILYSVRYLFLPLAIICFFAALILFISLMHRVQEEGAFDRIYLDLHVGFLCTLSVLEIMFLSVLGFHFTMYLFVLIGLGVFFTIDYIYAMRLCMSVSIRVKHQNFLKSFLCVRMVKGIGSFLAAVFGSIPFIWKALMGAGIILLADMRITSQMDWKPGTVLLEKMVLGFGILIILMNFDRLQKRAKALAEGGCGSESGYEIYAAVLSETWRVFECDSGGDAACSWRKSEK